MARSSGLGHRLTAAGMLAVGLAVPAGPAAAGPEEDAFASGGYTSCDAKLVAMAWSTTDLGEVRQDIGRKLMNGYEDQVKDALDSGRQTNAGNLLLCPPEELYSTADIDAFGLYWNEGRQTARDSISRKLLAGDKAQIDEAIAEGKKKS